MSLHALAFKAFQYMRSPTCSSCQKQHLRSWESFYHHGLPDLPPIIVVSFHGISLTPMKDAFYFNCAYLIRKPFSPELKQRNWELNWSKIISQALYNTNSCYLLQNWPREFIKSNIISVRDVLFTP